LSVYAEGIRALASAHGQFTANVPLLGLRISRNRA
jgi:hypothetical protein